MTTRTAHETDDVRAAVMPSRVGPAGPSDRRRYLAAGWVVPLAAAAVGGSAAATGDQSDIGGWGLIQALPWPYFAALVALALSFLLQLFRQEDHALDRGTSLLLAAHAVALVFLLHGAPALLEAEPRFPTAWLHAGFTDQILVHGVARPEVDARFNWPGFFATAATVAGAAGIDDPVALLRWAPTAAVLMYLPPLFLVARHLTRSPRAAWLAVFLFVAVNWVGQDYFAPQTAGFLMYLWWVALLVLFFREGDQLRLPRALGARRDRIPLDGDPDLPSSTNVRVAALLGVLALTAAVSMSHQLTPMMMGVVSASLVVAGRLRLVSLPVLTVLLTLGWISVAATAYWLGHLDDMFGNVGNLNASVGGVKGRVGGSPEHLAVVKLRLLFSAVMWGSTGLGLWFLWFRRRQPPLTLLILVAAPFAGLAQPYGGEAMMRVFLFSAPFACTVLAQTAFALPWRRTARLLVAVVALATLPLFVLIRYGNESFEQVRPEEVQAMEALYDIAPLGSNIVSPVSQVPWRFVHAADYRYRRPADAIGFRLGEPSALRGLLDDRDLGSPATYLVVTRSQVVYAHEALGEPEGWFKQVVRPRLTEENGYRLVYRNPSTVIYEFTGAGG